MGDDPLGDRALVAGILAGDGAAFDALFARHSKRVRQRLLRVTRDPAASEDLLQEVFLRLWTRGESYQGRGALIGWLLRTATNLALNHLRSHRRRRQQPLEWGDEDEAVGGDALIDRASLRPDEILERGEAVARIRELVDAMPEHHRDVLRMASEAEIDITAMARALEIPPGTVKSRLHHARARLARDLEELDND